MVTRLISGAVALFAYGSGILTASLCFAVIGKLIAVRLTDEQRMKALGLLAGVVVLALICWSFYAFTW